MKTFDKLYVPVKLVSITLSQSSSFILKKIWSDVIPALLIKTSGNKFCSFKEMAAAFIDSLQVISSFKGIRFSKVESNLNSFLAVPITLNPIFARWIAIDNPIPLEAPEINTILLLRFGY